MLADKTCPNYLKQYKNLWKKDPHSANLEWWKNAKFGMFIHYGLYSMLGANEWIQYRNEIPVAEYAKLKNSFTAHNFDADYITELALEAGMTYVNMVTCHHDGFCLWNSKYENFNSVNSPCKRDLVIEMSEMCDKKGLGFFTYYTFIQNWKHPYAPDTSVFNSSRPHYKHAQPEYLYKNKQDADIFINYMCECIKELLNDTGITAGIWFDIIMGYHGMVKELGFDINKIYNMIRKERPDILISFKQGATGTEDFCTPEQHFHSLEDKIRATYGESAAIDHRRVWEINKFKYNEINATLQAGSWSFDPFMPHRNSDYCYNLLGHAAQMNSNLCLNVGLLGDGSISPIQTEILIELGARIKSEGFPAEGDIKDVSAEYDAG